MEAETAPAWYQRTLRERAANTLLDAAAEHCFVRPGDAVGVVRWSRLRRLDAALAEHLATGPGAFGVLRAEHEDPAVWAALPEPRHEAVPAWMRFREAAETWLRVQSGEPWEFPAALPGPPPSPVAPSRAAEVTPLRAARDRLEREFHDLAPLAGGQSRASEIDAPRSRPGLSR